MTAPFDVTGLPLLVEEMLNAGIQRRRDQVHHGRECQAVYAKKFTFGLVLQIHS
jgi:hypothetical protein